MTKRSPGARTLAPAGITRPGPLLAVFVTLAVLLAAAPVGPPTALAAGHRGEFALGVYFGGGSYDNTDFNRELASRGYDPIESGIEYGFGGDYRMSDWVSVGIVAMRIGGDTTPPAGVDPTRAVTYGVHSSPIIVNLIAHPYRWSHGNVDVFGGVGPMLNTTASSTSLDYSSAGNKVGTYAHLGGAVEYRFSPMVGLSFTGLVRSARANNFVVRVPENPDLVWDLTFNGSAFWFGPRIYLGATE